MKKAVSIIFVIFLLMAGFHANAQAQSSKGNTEPNISVRSSRITTAQEQPTGSARAQENARRRAERRERLRQNPFVRLWEGFLMIPIAVRIGLLIVLIIIMSILFRKRKTEKVIEGTLESTEIHKAAMSGNMEELVAFINEEPEVVNARDEEGRTPLHMAALFQQTNVCDFLIERGADVNAKDKTKKTPLHSAAMGRTKAVTVLLIENGADVNAKDASGFTPLQMADKECGDVLLRYGATPSGK